MKEIDARGLACPQPVILAKNAVKEQGIGTVKVLVDNEMARENLKKFASNNNLKVLVEEKGSDFHISLTKESEMEEMLENTLLEQDLLDYRCGVSKKKGTVVVVKSDRFGGGADELGTILMKSYTFALSESEPLPKAMLLLNGGVKLACEGSEVIPNLQKIAEGGTEIYCCGTCLDFFQLKDKMQVGTVGNMYLFIEKMNEAEKVITIG